MKNTEHGAQKLKIYNVTFFSIHCILKVDDNLYLLSVSLVCKEQLWGHCNFELLLWIFAIGPSTGALKHSNGLGAPQNPSADRADVKPATDALPLPKILPWHRQEHLLCFAPGLQHLALRSTAWMSCTHDLRDSSKGYPGADISLTLMCKSLSSLSFLSDFNKSELNRTDWNTKEHVHGWNCKINKK